MDLRRRSLYLLKANSFSTALVMFLDRQRSQIRPVPAFSLGSNRGLLLDAFLARGSQAVEEVVKVLVLENNVEMILGDTGLAGDEIESLLEILENASQFDFHVPVQLLQAVFNELTRVQRLLVAGQLTLSLEIRNCLRL